MKYKGCPRCGKKMPLEVKGQCEECKKKRYKSYKELPGSRREKAQVVYNNSEWRRVRREVIKQADGLCEVCKAQGRLKKGDEVHHIVKVSRGNSSTNFNLNNLIYVCTSCHRKIERLNLQELLGVMQHGE